MAVIFDKGAAPTEIVRGVRSFAEVTFLVADSSEARLARPVLETLGRTVTFRSVEDAVAAHKVTPFDGVVTFSERMVLFAAEVASALGLPGNSTAAGLLLTDKLEQRRCLAAAEVDAVRCDVVDSVMQWPAVMAAVGLPAVVKPVVGEGSRNAFLVEDGEAGGRLVERLLSDPAEGEQRLIVEEFLAGEDHYPFGDYVSVESMAAYGEVTHIMVSGKFPLTPPFREIGAFWPTHLGAPERAAVESLTTSALEALGVGTGLFHTEIKLTATGPRIIEINGRLGGDMNDLGQRSGVGDLIALGARLALGERAVLNAPSAGVYFQYSTPAPAEPCRLLSVKGADLVRKMPGVQRYHRFARPGDELGRGVHWRPMDMVCGVASNHDEMVSNLTMLRNSLSFVFEVQGIERELSAAALTGWTY
ncbi:hypothetical protein AB0368_30155 [Actinoplanes sp. NPDC051475]|uniref:hypothetical protein n=1 Tax=Actinoplanes sp. NPDC051475 TaxID=3157225 RepID=UPI003450680E